MPLYAYQCKNCGENFEKVRSMNDRDEELACPACGAMHPQRVLASFSLGSGGSSGGSSGGAPRFT